MMYLFRERMSLPIIMQGESNECGLACLAMICCFHGKGVDIVTLRNRFRLSAAGASVKQLLTAASNLGLQGRPLKLELEDITRLALPVILHWDLDHFVVLSKLTRRYAVIHDPAVGSRRYQRNELSRHFTGVAIELQPVQEFTAENLAHDYSLRQLLPRSKGQSQFTRQVFVLSLLLQCMFLLSPLYLQLAIDQGIGKGNMDLLPMLALLFALVIISKTVISYFRGLISLQFSNQLGFQLVSNTCAHLLRLPLSFFEKREMGDIVSRFSALESIKQLVTQEMITVVVDGLFSLITLVLLFLYSPLLALVGLAFLALMLVIRLGTMAKERQLRQEVLVCGARQQTRFMENVRGIVSLKNYGMEQDRTSEWRSLYAHYINSSFHLGRFQMGINSLQSLLTGFDNLLTIYLGSTLVVSSNLSVGQLMGFIFLKQYFSNSVTALLPKLTELRMLRLHLERIADISQQTAEHDPCQYGLLQRTVKGEIGVQDLSFSYPGMDCSLISQMNFTIKAGTCVAIVGASGCGKTTLLKLLLGLEQPDSGKILIDGIRLQEFGVSRYRQQMAVIMHNEQLLAGDLCYNIVLSPDPLDSNRLQKACIQAGILDLINALPLGFNTQVGEMGTLFSAGQTQRILLARAFYRKPKLLVLDEALSHLGEEATNHVMNAISELGITVILVTHNTSLASRADSIITIENKDNEPSVNSVPG